MTNIKTHCNTCLSPFSESNIRCSMNLCKSCLKEYNRTAQENRRRNLKVIKKPIKRKSRKSHEYLNEDLLGQLGIGS
jgi:hypothetical protein